jgi:hypothetical protein
MERVAFSAAEVARWHGGDVVFVVQAAAAYEAGRISASELQACSSYAAGGPAPPGDVARRVNG